MPTENLRTYLDRKVEAVQRDRDGSWMPIWREANKYVLPMEGRFINNDAGRARKRNEKITNEAATFAVDTAQRGLLYNVTNPARPWLKLKTPWTDLNKVPDVKRWLEAVTELILDTFQRANVYTELPSIYTDLMSYGTAAAIVNRDSKTTIRLETFPVGSFALAVDGAGRVDTLVREFQMTRRQLVTTFGQNNVSTQTAEAWRTGIGLEDWVEVRHMIEPNPDHKPASPLAMHRKYRSIYWEVQSKEDKFLSISGFDTFRALTPRWNVQKGDAYGVAPVMSVFGTIKGLQTLEKQSLQLLAKVINPPLNVPPSMRGKAVTQLAGGVNYTSHTDQGKIEPAFQISNVPLADVEAKIQNYEARIRKALFEDVFLMIAQMDEGVTATEVRARIEQKIQTLGPILLRLNDELLDMLVESTFEILASEDMLPPVPEELQDKPLQVEYVSEMAKAMKLAGVSGIERTIGFIGGQVAPIRPEVVDKLNPDAIADIYSELSGAPVDILNTEDAVKAIRQKRTQEQAQAQAIAKANATAEIAQKMGQTPTEGDTLLNAAAGVPGVPAA